MKPVRLFTICFLTLVVIALAWKTVRTRAFQPTNPPFGARQVAIPQKSSLPPPAAVPQPNAPQLSPAEAPAPAAAGDEKETVERLGPFTISGNNYTVVLHKKHLAASEDAGPNGAEGVVAMEIVDTTGTILYQRTYPLWADSESLSAWSVSAHILKGTNSKGLLLRSRPSESSGFYDQIFGVVDGKLVPFCGPFAAMDVKADASGEYHTGSPLRRQADEIQVTIGTGRFVMVVPIRIDWTLGKLSLAPQCPEAAVSGTHPVCKYELLDPNSLLQKPESVTWVRLYAQPDENAGKPERVVVKPASKIEILACSADMDLKQPDFLHPPLPGEFPVKDMAQISPAPNTDTWLQVRIDGKVGWIHSDEDFTAIGLPAPGDEIDPP